MVLPLWGLLQKSQDDPETIEQAIVRIVAEHAADPEAHLGEGESLSDHKHEDVIDHPPGSVLPDKIPSANSFFLLPTWPTADLDTDNVASAVGGFVANVTQNTGQSGTGSLTLRSFVLPDWGYNDGDVVLDSIFHANRAAGDGVARLDLNFAAIEIAGNQYRLGRYDGSWSYSSWASLDVFRVHRWRVHYNAAFNELYFYLNGEQVGAYSFTPTFPDDELFVKLLLTRGTSSTITGNIGNVQLAFDSSDL